MKKLLTMFALGSTMFFASCGDDGKPNASDNADNKIIQLQQPGDSKAVSPCIIEVPCNEPELTVSGHEHLRKFYDFCDSTVTITWNSLTATGGYTNGYYTKDHETRSITDVHGTEKIEMQGAYSMYQSRLALGK